MSWEIVTKAQVSALSGLPQSKFEDDWYDWVAGLLKLVTPYEYVGETTTITDETHDGDGRDLLRVKYPPIVSVTSLTIDDTAVGSSKYKVYDNYVRLIEDIYEIVPARFPVGTQNVSITYVSGMATAPEDVKVAVASAVVYIALYKLRGASIANLQYSVPSTGEGQPDRPLTFHSIARAVITILRQGVLRKRLRFD